MAYLRGFCYTFLYKEHRKGDPVMAVQSFTEEELQNLDKQTLIKLFLTTSLSSQQIILQQTKQIELLYNGSVVKTKN